MSLFGQILAALYQEDLVEEDYIRAWHRLAESKGTDRKEGPETDNFQKCWMIGSHMIQQFDAQESESEEETESEDDDGDETRMPATPRAAAVVPAAIAARARQQTVASSEDGTESGDDTASTSTEGVDGGESESASEVSAGENSSRPVSATTSEDETTESESEDDGVLVH